MNSLRPKSLNRVLVCLGGIASFVVPNTAVPTLIAQTAPPQSAPPTPQTPPVKKPANPFETVGPAGGAAPAQIPAVQTPPAQIPPAQTPPKPALEAPAIAPKMAAPAGPVLESNIIEAIQFRGARRVPQDTLRALIFTKVGDIYNEDALRRAFIALWNTNRFDDIKLESEPGDRGGTVITFVVTERPVVRDIKYEGAKSVTTSDILDRFKERKVGLVVESMYDPNKVNRAAVVLKDLLAEHGRQFATVTPELRRIPPSSLEIIFRVDEGPKVKVGEITILGNTVFSHKEILRAMKNLKPIGIPYSIWFESLFAKTYDSSKLEEDKERIRDSYQKKGYFTAKALEQKVEIKDLPPGKLHIPFTKPGKPGKAADITIPLEEGPKYFLDKVDFTGVKLFKSTEFLARLFGMAPGDPFSTEKLRNGLKNLTKVYSQFGYIDYVGEPDIQITPNSNRVNLTINADEGKQFFVRRIDFTGNTTTRDKVIRREILLDEGDAYNSSLWDTSILRLNQLGYFEALKENESYELKRNPGTNTVDINLKVKERGKNSIGLNGGVSGIAGTFVGLNYSTNNFLGLGETLSIESQLGTRTRDVSLGFTEPYFLDRPLQVGAVIYIRQFNYNQAREQSLLTGQNLTSYYNSLGNNNLLNYAQNSKGISFSLSYPLRRSFARLGLSLGYDNSSINAKSNAASTYFTYINFQGVTGPNSLNGIKTAKIVPSYSYNSKNAQMSPTAGRSVFASLEFAASVLGANVNTIRPTFDMQYYKTNPWKRSHVFAFHLLANTIFGYGGKVAPPYSRTYIGGENDVRGFDFFSISPIAFVASTADVGVYNNDGTRRTQKVLSGGQLFNQNVSQGIPTYQLVTPGGDTQTVFNFEYRIPIFGPVTMALFGDAGLNRILFTNQLRMNSGRVDQLNELFPQAGFDGRVKISGGTQAIRTSTGIELQVLLPVVQAPFRIYWAYNPTIVRENIQTPIVADRSFFPNNQSFLNAIVSFGQAYPLREKHSVFRFTIGRTF